MHTNPHAHERARPHKHVPPATLTTPAKVVRNLPASLSYILRHCGTPEELGFPDLPADAAGSPVFDVPVKKWSSGCFKWLETLTTSLKRLSSNAIIACFEYFEKCLE